MKYPRDKLSEVIHQTCPNLLILFMNSTIKKNIIKFKKIKFFNFTQYNKVRCFAVRNQLRNVTAIVNITFEFTELLFVFFCFTSSIK